MQRQSEAQARQARYQAYQQHLQENEICCLLIIINKIRQKQLFCDYCQVRGVDGLAAMQAIDYRKRYDNLAPPLDLTRESKSLYGPLSLEVKYIDDPMNYDTHYDRVWCREVTVAIFNKPFSKNAASFEPNQLSDARCLKF
ncbi:ATP-binding protein [Acinetobacter baumannii]